MQITVRFSGPLRALAGHQSLTLSLGERATLRDLLRALCDALPTPFIEQVVTPLEAGTGPLTLVLVNRARLREQTDLERPLADGDVVAFVPPMAGG